MDNIIDSIEDNEGFSSIPYPDPIHGWDKTTFGHGLTHITYDESIWIVKRRVKRIDRILSKSISFYSTAPTKVKNVLIEMAYQMGIVDLLEFKNTLAYLEQEEYHKASREMLNSLWAKIQTPERAKRLSDIIAGVSNDGIEKRKL